MEAILEEAVRQLRLGMEAAGSASLVALIDELLKRMANPTASPLLQSDLPLLKDLIAGQNRGDFLYVADILEYEIRPRIVVSGLD